MSFRSDKQMNQEQVKKKNKGHQIEFHYQKKGKHSMDNKRGLLSVRYKKIKERYSYF